MDGGTKDGGREGGRGGMMEEERKGGGENPKGEVRKEKEERGR